MIETCDKCKQLKLVDCFLHGPYCERCEGLECPQCEAEKNDAATSDK